jgi:ATP-dependent Lhr-like helicase
MSPRRGLEALLDAIEILQGAPLLVSDLERDILPARVAGYRPQDLDELLASGEVLWIGEEQVGDRDGRVALYLTESVARLLPPPATTTAPDTSHSERAQRIVEVLRERGATFFADLHRACGGNYPGDTQEAILELIWRGKLTNDTLHPLRNLVRPRDTRAHRGLATDGRPGSPEFLRSLRARGLRRTVPEGRWSLVEQRTAQTPSSAAEYSAAVAQQMLTRYGIVMREATSAEDVSGGYSSLYPALKTMEEGGWIRRGMFVAGMGAAQFASTAAVDMLRSLRREPEAPEALYLAASDPANPYGSLLPWPRSGGTDENLAGPHGMARAAGAGVILLDGQLAAFLRRMSSAIRVFLPEDEPERSRGAAALARRLAELAAERQGRRSGLLITTINEKPAAEHFLARFLEDAGFIASAAGFQMRRVIASTIVTPAEEEDEQEQETAQHA